MNFGKVIKKELLSKPIKDRCCKKAFLAGFVRGSGALYEEDGFLCLEFTANDEETAELIISLFRIVFKYEIREISVSEDRLNKKDKIVLNVVGERAIEILKELGVLIEDNDETVVNLKLYSTICEKECCLRAFIKGLFLAVGGCTVPSEDGQTTGYHAELVFSHYTPALETAEKLASFNVQTKITRRKDTFIVYIKSAEEIKNFTAFLGAPVSVLKLTDLMINREITNKTNRRMNCDLGNVNRQIEATDKQLSAIDKIEKTMGLDALKPDLKTTAIARREHADYTMVELAEFLSITKSCLNHRLRKIVCIANEL